MALKKEIFKKLDEGAPVHAILASNTSYLNISEMASATKRPEKVVGIHFFNPVAVMQLVEVVRGGRTSVETIEVACDLAKKLGKEPVVCRDIELWIFSQPGLSGHDRRGGADGLGESRVS